jgi:hypothetical protein
VYQYFLPFNYSYTTKNTIVHELVKEDPKPSMSSEAFVGYCERILSCARNACKYTETGVNALSP